MVSSLGTQATIIEGKSGNVTILKEYGEQRYMIRMTPENWRQSNKNMKGLYLIIIMNIRLLQGTIAKKQWASY